MELQQLRLFLAAAESESFTRGAQRAFVSQPALSASISKLEVEMGVKLFIRHKRSVVLTPAGRMLLKRAKVIIGECAKAKHELKRHDEQPTIRLGVINTLSVNCIVKLVEQYRRNNPALVLHVIDADKSELQRLEREARIDVSLTVLSEHQQPSGRQSETVQIKRPFIYNQALFSEPYVVAFAPDHHLHQSSSVTLEELAKEPFISRSHCEHKSVIQALIKSRQVRMNIAYVTDQDERALALVKADMGVTIVPEHYCHNGIKTCHLVESNLARTVGFEWGQSDNADEIKRLVAFATTARWF